MDIRSAGEALYIACEMEKRAIRLYERALMVFAGEPCAAAVRLILGDERNHLCHFSQMGASSPDFERAQLLSARASQVLFAGGLVEAQRKGAFASSRRLLAFAAEEEREAAACYGDFANRLQGEASAAFSAVAQEERAHLARLNELLNGAADEEKEKTEP